ncbi:MAG: regulatory protein RecX [Bacillota bacterium]|nr:regulatory protein RecX [Bacillota bacterium]
MSWNKRPKQDLSEQPEAIYPAALAYLAQRDYAAEELRERLLSRGAEPEACGEVICRLLQQRYLDDARFALGRVRQRREFNGRSRALIRHELRELGLEESLIQQALEAEYSAEQESALLERLLRAELRRLQLSDDALLRRKQLASLQRRLLGKGFPPGQVYQALQFLLEEQEEE